ncbi:MAG: NUDIX hydrolase [bacterium]|nr:NUDIX hydrolase [bacterium]
METPKYTGKIFEIFDREVERDGQKKFTAEIVRRPPGTRLIIVKDDKVLLTKEYRFEIGEYDFRLPGGKVYDTLEEYKKALTSGVNIVEAAKAGAIKEAAEEAGIKANNAAFLQKSICGMTVIWELFYFLISDFTQDVQHLEQDEDIQVVWTDRNKAREMCLDGSMKEERSALVLLKYLENKF